VPRLRRTAAIVLAMLSILALAAPVAAKPGSGNSTGSAACENGGYLNWTRDSGTAFKNEGDCAKYTARGGVLLPMVRISASYRNTFIGEGDASLPALTIDITFSGLVPDPTFGWGYHMGGGQGETCCVQADEADGSGTTSIQMACEIMDPIQYMESVYVRYQNVEYPVAAPDATMCAHYVP
jgi:hypothetical protein